MAMRHLQFFPGSIPSCIEFETSSEMTNSILSGIWYQRFEGVHKTSQQAGPSTDQTHCHARQVSGLSLAQSGDCPLRIIKVDQVDKNADFRLGLIFSSRLVREGRNTRSMNSRCVSPAAVYNQVQNLVRGEPPVDCFGEEVMIASASILTWLWLLGALSQIIAQGLLDICQKGVPIRFSFTEEASCGVAFKLTDRIMRTYLEIITEDRGRASDTDKFESPVSSMYKVASMYAHLRAMLEQLTEEKTYDEIQIFDVNSHKREFGLCVLQARPEIKLKKMYIWHACPVNRGMFVLDTAASVCRSVSKRLYVSFEKIEELVKSKLTLFVGEMDPAETGIKSILSLTKLIPDEFWCLEKTLQCYIECCSCHDIPRLRVNQVIFWFWKGLLCFCF